MGGNADGQILYNFNTIDGAVAAIDSAKTSMRSILTQLESDLRPLETGAWTSDAQAAYKARKDRWEAGANDIATILDQVKVALQNAAGRMRDTDRKASSYFQP